MIGGISIFLKCCIQQFLYICIISNGILYGPTLTILNHYQRQLEGMDSF